MTCEAALVLTTSLTAWRICGSHCSDTQRERSLTEPELWVCPRLMEIIGGLAAVAQLCGTARTLAKVIYRFSRNVGGASGDVRRFANQVQTFSDLVEAAELSLHSYCTKNPKSPLVVFIRSRRILDNIGDEAKAVQEHLRDIRARVRGLRSSSILWASFKWTWNKSSILELVPEMESVKGSLNLLLAISGFEERTGAGRNGSDEEM